MSNALCSLIIFCSPNRNCRPSCTIPRFSEYYLLYHLIHHHTLAMSLHALLLSCSPSRNWSQSCTIASQNYLTCWKSLSLLCCCPVLLVEILNFSILFCQFVEPQFCNLQHDWWTMWTDKIIIPTYVLIGQTAVLSFVGLLQSLMITHSLYVVKMSLKPRF